MKTIWITVILLVIVLAGSFVLYYFTSIQYGALQDNLAKMGKAVEREDWEGARREAARLRELWRRCDAFWTPIMDHRQVDRLDESLTRTLHVVEQRQKRSALLEIAVARRIMRRVKDAQLPSLQNIF
jgi:hypothetical protein